MVLKIILSEKKWSIVNKIPPKVYLSAPVGLMFFEKMKPHTLRDLLFPEGEECPRRAWPGETEAPRRSHPGVPDIVQGWRLRVCPAAHPGSCLGCEVLERPG